MPRGRLARDAIRHFATPLKGDVVCFGFLTYCLLLMVDRLPPRNGGALILDSVETVGDDAAIVSSVLTNWSVPARLISSPIGNDHYGERVREYLGSWGLDVAQRVNQGFQTPFEIGILDPSGGRTYFQRREASALSALTAPSAAELTGAGLLYVDWYDGPSALAAMQTAISLDVPVFLNLESQYDKGPQSSSLLRYASICQVSLDEPGASGSPRHIARSLISQGVGTVLVTMGADGCLVAQRQEVYSVRPPAVKVVDCYGAGAAFAAGIIYGLREGWSLEDVARFACAYSALKCEVSGIAGLPVNEIWRIAATLDVRPLSL